MASMKSKRAATVATLAAALMLGGTAFAASPTGVAGPARNHTAVAENPIGEAYAVVVSAINDANRQTLPPTTTAQTLGHNPLGLIGEAYAVVVSALNDANRQSR